MSQLPTIIVSVGPPRPISLPTTIATNTLPTCTTTAAGDLTGCVYTPICSSQWVVSASGTLDKGGFPILVCTPTSSGSMSTSTSSGESITPTGIASASLPHTPLTTGPTTSTGTGTGTTTSTGTTAPVSKSHAARNIGSPSGIPGFIILAWIGVYIFHSRRH
jgi:hypothetical protein